MIKHLVDYATTHVVHVAISVIIMALLPLFTIVISDPMLEAHESAQQSYSIQCGAFYSRAVGRAGKTECTSYAWSESCWDIIEKVHYALSVMQRLHRILHAF